jgi:glutamine synthetase
VTVEQYVTKLNIEAETATDIARTMLLPAAVRYLGQLRDAGDGTGLRKLSGEVGGLIDEFVDAIHALEKANLAHPEVDDVIDAALYVRDTVIPAMDAVRGVADRLERIVPDSLWPLPKYSEILFIK